MSNRVLFIGMSLSTTPVVGSPDRAEAPAEQGLPLVGVDGLEPPTSAL